MVLIFRNELPREKKKLILLNNVPSSFIKKDNKYLFKWIIHYKENEVLKIRNSFNVLKKLRSQIKFQQKVILFS